MSKYISTVFASGGDFTYPPDGATDGSVNLNAGYTPQYEIDISTGDPTARAVERNIMNGLFNWLFDNQAFDQAHGLAPWFSSYAGGYPINALVADNSTGVWQIYRSLVSNNSAIPTATSSWEMIITQTELLNRIPFAVGGAAGSANGAVASGADFNSWSYSQGVWLVSTDAIATGISNIPSNRQGVLIARNTNANYNPTNTSSGGSFFQLYIDANGNAYLRFFGVPAGGSTAIWTGWRPFAFLDSPNFTGIPTAPTAAQGTSTTQIASTAFVTTGLTGISPGRLVGKPTMVPNSGAFSWNPTNASVRLIFVRAQAAGGGGAGGRATSSGYNAGGGGGGGGGYAEGWFLVSALSLPVACSVGAGGAGAYDSNTPGDGGDTYFGNLVYATGGKGGNGTFGVQYQGGTIVQQTGGRPGYGTKGDKLMPGGGGGNILLTQVGNSVAGYGGSSQMSGNTYQEAQGASGNGRNGLLGAGGSGGLSSSSPDAAYSGGYGGDGFMEIWEFY